MTEDKAIYTTTQGVDYIKRMIQRYNDVKTSYDEMTLFVNHQIKQLQSQCHHPTYKPHPDYPQFEICDICGYVKLVEVT